MELEKEKMDAMKALADTNMKVSEAKVTLANIKKLESSYLQEREQKVIAMIDSILAQSKDIIDEARGNYKQVVDLFNTVSSFSKFLTEIHDGLLKTMESFSAHTKEWEKSVKLREDEIGDIKKQIRCDQVRIENEKKGIEQTKLSLEKQQRIINDQRGTLERAFTRLKNNRI